MKLGSAADFLLDISETDLSTLTASIKAPSGRDEPCLLKRLPNNHIGEPGAAFLAGAGREVGVPPVLRWGPSRTLGDHVSHLLGHTW